MAASQARFLGLTARKTNTEFEGQQINQQRTTLANQSANYYNQMLGMKVPVPPSTTDYTKTVYTFNDGNLTNSITSMVAKGDGTYLVSYLQTWANDFAPIAAGNAVITRTAKGSDYTYKIGSLELRDLGTEVTLGSDIQKSDPYLSTFTTKDQLKKVADEEAQYKKMLNKKYGSDGESWSVRYVYDTTSATYNPYFYNTETMKKAIYDAQGISQSSIQAYKIGSTVENKEVKGAKAELEKDATGRYINITLYDQNDHPITYALTTNTSTDEEAYNDAMNQYEYDKAKYDKDIQEINAQIEIVQAQDRNLELRLKQLDTEQDAISNEMDAVQKVIEKNTESSFKTFG